MIFVHICKTVWFMLVVYCLSILKLANAEVMGTNLGPNCIRSKDGKISTFCCHINGMNRKRITDALAKKEVQLIKIQRYDLQTKVEQPKVVGFIHKREIDKLFF